MKLTRRQMAMLTAAFATSGLTWRSADAKIVDTETALQEMIIGDPKAPVEVIEYASLACPACRYFHENVYPTIKKDYIDTGKVKFIYRDFPTNTPALAAAMIARCAGPERHTGMVDIFFDTQPQWGRSENPLQALTMVAQMAGIGPGEVDACLKDSNLMNGIQSGAQKAHEDLGVSGTPTVFVAGKMVENANELKDMTAAIDKALKGY